MSTAEKQSLVGRVDGGGVEAHDHLFRFWLRGGDADERELEEAVLLDRRAKLKAGANVQDTCVMHGFPQRDTVVEENGHIGHGAVLHSCTVGRDALVGMNAVVMDDAVVGAQSIVAASAFVPAGMRIPPRSLVAGVPAKVRRELSDQEIAWKLTGTQAYQELTRRCLATIREVQPLAAIEDDRPKLRHADVKPLIDTQRG